MKKKILVVLILCFSIGTASVFADHPGDALGIGALLRTGGGLSGFGGLDAGASIKLPKVPVFWGFFVNVNNGYVGTGVTGDYYFFDKNLVTEGNFVLDWFLGGGLYANLFFVSDDLRLALGGRAPVGLAWQINDNWEVFLVAAPNLGVRILPDVRFDFFFDGELGFRYWFR